jgi:hypothetical protein
MREEANMPRKRHRDHGPNKRQAFPRGHLGYANVIASLALFVALGGTGVAAVTLDRNSVGAPQIRDDAVRAPEIASDAVRSPEIRSGAVRSSEIRDEGINITDISSRARTELRGALNVAEDERSRNAETCEGADLSVCPNHLELQLASSETPATGGRRPDPQPTEPGAPDPGPQADEAGRNWLVQAKLHITAIKGGTLEPSPESAVTPDSTVNRCGLVNARAEGPRAVLDEVEVGASRGGVSENIALSAFVSKRAKNPLIALRCTEQLRDQVIPSFVKITALEVGAVTVR